MLGFKIELAGGISKVSLIALASPAALSGISKDDEIFSVNGFKVENNLNELCSYFEKDELILNVFSLKKLKEVKLKPSHRTFFDHYEIVEMAEKSREQTDFLKAWGY
jgi:predicted metalloprotease with PDZ domain